MMELENIFGLYGRLFLDFVKTNYVRLNYFNYQLEVKIEVVLDVFDVIYDINNHLHVLNLIKKLHIIKIVKKLLRFKSKYFAILFHLLFLLQCTT